jgi:hypothetical protein
MQPATCLTLLLLPFFILGCGSSTETPNKLSSTGHRGHAATAIHSSVGHPAPSGASSTAALPALLSLLHRCALVKSPEVASAYDAAFAHEQVSSVFGARESSVKASYSGAGSEPPAIYTCNYNATLAGYGAYSVYTLEWTVDPTAVASFLNRRTSKPGDSGFVLTQPPQGFTTAYEDNGGLFLARPGIAVTLGGALGSGVNKPLDEHAATAIGVCVSRDEC